MLHATKPTSHILQALYTTTHSHLAARNAVVPLPCANHGLPMRHIDRRQLPMNHRRRVSAAYSARPLPVRYAQRSRSLSASIQACPSLLAPARQPRRQRAYRPSPPIPGPTAPCTRRRWRGPKSGGFSEACRVPFVVSFHPSRQRRALRRALGCPQPERPCREADHGGAQRARLLPYHTS